MDLPEKGIAFLATRAGLDIEHNAEGGADPVLMQSPSEFL